MWLNAPTLGGRKKGNIGDVVVATVRYAMAPLPFLTKACVREAETGPSNAIRAVVLDVYIQTLWDGSLLCDACEISHHTT